MRNKEVEFNPYIYTLSKLCWLAMKYPGFYYAQQGGIQNSRWNSRLIRHEELSRNNRCHNFPYVHSSRKHWK